MTIRKRISLALSILAGLIFCGSAGFHYLEGWTWFDGFYMTITTMSTVGYTEIHPLSHAGRLFNSFLIMASVLGGGFTIATFTQGLLEFEFAKLFGGTRMEREISKLSGHYIVCGAGRVGRTVVRELRARGQKCLVIERDALRAKWAESENFPVIIGNASSEETLKLAQISRAQGLVSAVSSDAENLYVVLTARGLRPDLLIIARVSEDDASSKFLRAGASHVISPYSFVGHRIAQRLVSPHVLDFIDAAVGTERLDVEISEIQVRPQSSLTGRNLADSLIRQEAGVIVLGLKSATGPMLFNPAPETAIQANDFLIVIGNDAQIKKLEALASAPD